jgi:hypothetical protein
MVLAAQCNAVELHAYRSTVEGLRAQEHWGWKTLLAYQVT